MSQRPSRGLVEQIDVLYDSNTDIKLIALCTADGFSIHQASKEFENTPDKISAITSTLSSVSDSISREIMSAPFSINCIESDHGNCVSVYTQYRGKNVVLTVSADAAMSLGELRVRTKKLAHKISELAD